MIGPDSILQSFGEAEGLPGLCFDVQGQAIFRTKSNRLLGMERTGADMLIYTALPVRYDRGAWLRRACKCAHHSRLDDWPVQPALRDYDGTTHLLALTRLDERELTESRLRQALEYLSRWLDALDTEP